MTNNEIARLSGQAMAAYDAGNFQEALLQFERLCSLCRKDARAWFMRGLSSRGLGDMEHAAKCMEHVLLLDPEYVDAHLTLAEVLQGQGKLMEAVDNFHRVLELDPDNTVVRPLLAAAYGSMASECQQRRCRDCPY